MDLIDVDGVLGLGPNNDKSQSFIMGASKVNQRFMHYS